MKHNIDLLKVIQNTAKNRFEIKIDESTAIAEYMITAGKIVLTHTEVPEALEGNGIASRLAKFAFKYAKENDLKVLPLCPYMAAFARKHPEVQDVLIDSFKV